MLVGLALEGIKEVQLVYLGIEKMILSLLHSEHECWVGHIDVYLLYHKPFRTFTPILVGSLAVAFILPFSFTFTLLGITSSDIRHDSVNRLGNRLLSASCRGAQNRTYCCFVLYIINVAESGFQEMRSKRRKYSLRYRWAIDGRCLRDEKLDELGQFLRHLMDVVEIGFGIMDIAEIFIIITPLSLRFAVSLLSQFDGCTHDAGHTVRLLSAAGTLHGGEGSLLVFAEGGDDLLDPCRIVIAEVAEIAGQGKDK